MNEINPNSPNNLEDDQRSSSDQNVSSRTRTALIVCAVLSLLLVGVIAYVKDQKSNTAIMNSDPITSTSLIETEVPFRQISIAGLNSLEIDSDERLNNVLKQFEIPTIEPGAVPAVSCPGTLSVTLHDENPGAFAQCAAHDATLIT